MAIDKKTLQRFLDNPAMFKLEDMGLDEVGEAQAPDESMGLEEVPALEPEGMLEAPESDLEGEELASNDEDGMNELLTTLRDDLNEKHNVGAKAIVDGKELPQTDSPELARFKRLKAGEPMESEEDESIDSDVASDMKAPIDLRKKALQRIKQKYLGQ